MSRFESLYRKVRFDLVNRFEGRFASLPVRAGRTVKFYGSRRGQRFRVARFKNRAQAKRIADNLRAVRRPLGRSVPKVLHDWVENNVVVTEFVKGRVVDRFGPDRLKKCVRLIARLHNVDISTRKRLGPMKSCFVDRLDTLVGRTRRIPAKKRPDGLREWLDHYLRLRRRRWPRVLIHGDPHEENFVWTADGDPALIDWDLSMPGAPHFDLAYMVYWRADSLHNQGRDEELHQTVSDALSTYNRAARGRGRKLNLKDFLLWLGCVGLGYVGFGRLIRDVRYGEMATWLWSEIENVAKAESVSLQ